jgi:hypothetical protein
MRAGLYVKMQGYTPANRDATVRLRNEATGAVIERKPFLDGTLLVRDLEPGTYEVEVTHPNLPTPIEKKTIRVFDQLDPTYVPVNVNPDVFGTKPVRDPEIADLTPVQQTATAVRETLRTIDGKAPGEAIRAADWNALVGAVSDLAGGVLQLTHLLTPRGHDHPWIRDEVLGVKTELQTFARAYGRNLLELRRDLEIAILRRGVSAVLDAGAASPATRERAMLRINELDRAIPSDPRVFTGRLAAAGDTFLNVINELAAAQGENSDAFLAREDVKVLGAAARSYSEAGVQGRAEEELHGYERAAAASGGKTLSRVVGG